MVIASDTDSDGFRFKISEVPAPLSDPGGSYTTPHRVLVVPISKSRWFQLPAAHS
jgi:hypothetical protein